MSVTVIEIIHSETRAGDLDEARRFHDPDLLACPVCGEKSYPEPLAFRSVSDGARPGLLPRGPLCPLPSPGACSQTSRERGGIVGVDGDVGYRVVQVPCSSRTENPVKSPARARASWGLLVGG